MGRLSILSQDEFLCASTGRRPSASRTQHCRFPPGARETRQTRHRLSADVSVRGAHFEHEF